MSLAIFGQAFILTFSMLFAVGPICMTVINTTIINGFRVGILAGLGVAVADNIYIIAASLAISALESILRGKAVVLIGVCGGLFLYYIAYKFWTAKTDVECKTIRNSGIKSFITLLCLTLTGPTTILTYSIVFSSFLSNQHFDALSAILGASLGAYLFYFLLVSVISIIRTKISAKVIGTLNKLATMIIVAMATALIYNGVKTLLA